MEMNYVQALILTIKVIAKMVYINIPGIIILLTVMASVRYITGNKRIWIDIFKKIGGAL